MTRLATPGFAAPPVSTGPCAWSFGSRPAVANRVRKEAAKGGFVMANRGTGGALSMPVPRPGRSARQGLVCLGLRVWPPVLGDAWVTRRVRWH